VLCALVLVILQLFLFFLSWFFRNLPEAFQSEQQGRETASWFQRINEW
jgi:hypothetical protein